MFAENDKNNLLRQIHAGNLKELIAFHHSYPEIHWSTIKHSKNGDTILHIASRNGFIDIVKYLLTKYPGNYVDIVNRGQKTSLHEAAQFTQLEVLTCLLEHNANVNALKIADWTPLMLACTKTNLISWQIIRLLLKKGADINFCNKDGWTALHIICREGGLELFKALVSCGADFDKCTKNGRTPLHISVLHRHFDISKFLIDIGADVNKSDFSGNTPIHEAILSSNIELSRCLITLGADVTAKNNAQYTILHLAASIGDISVIDFIVNELAYDVNVSTSTGLTPLHCAAKKKFKHAYDLLVSFGASENVTDIHKRLPFDYFGI